MRSTFVQTISRLAREDPKVMLVIGDTGFSPGKSLFLPARPPCPDESVHPHFSQSEYKLGAAGGRQSSSPPPSPRSDHIPPGPGGSKGYAGDRGHWFFCDGAL